MTLAIAMCALQDVCAFCIFLSRKHTKPRATFVSLVIFGAAFPIGAGLSINAWDLAHSGGAREAVGIARVVASALFLFMAAELAPPHTHSRLRNLQYACLFALGVGIATSSEMIEGIMGGDR